MFLDPVAIQNALATLGQGSTVDIDPGLAPAMLSRIEELASPIEVVQGGVCSILPSVEFTRATALEYCTSFLEGVAVGAVDGSQVYPDPIEGGGMGFISAGYFLNAHSQRCFTRHCRHWLLAATPGKVRIQPAGVLVDGRQLEEVDDKREPGTGGWNDLVPKNEGNADNGIPSPEILMRAEATCAETLSTWEPEDSGRHAEKTITDVARYMLECAMASVMMTSGARVCLLDGPLHPSFMSSYPADLGEAIRAGFSILIEGSGDATPVGFVDSPASSLIQTSQHGPTRVPDALVLASILQEPGSRTAFIQRGDSQVAFSYIRLGPGLPARVELTLHRARDPRARQVALVALLAEILAGRGYPQVLLKAHDTVVLGDTERRLFQVISSRSRSAERPKDLAKAGRL